MFATENADQYAIYIVLILSLIPPIYLIGHIFTRDGREAMKLNPLIPIYFVLMGIYSYYFWMAPHLIEAYVGISKSNQFILYGCLCLVPFFEKSLPN